MMRNFKGLTVCSCLAFALFYGDCWGMHKSESEPSLHTGMNIQTETVRPGSAPVTGQEIQEAINKWVHLVPENATTTQVNKALLEAIIHIESKECKHKMEVLVELICNPDHRSIYANYVHMVFIDALPDCDDEERNKFGGMLAGIANSSGGTASLFWDWYAKGYFDSMP